MHSIYLIYLKSKTTENQYVYTMACRTKEGAIAFLKEKWKLLVPQYVLQIWKDERGACIFDTKNQKVICRYKFVSTILH